MNLLKIYFLIFKTTPKIDCIGFQLSYLVSQNGKNGVFPILITAPSTCQNVFLQGLSANSFGIIFNTKTRETIHVSWQQQKSPSEVQEALGDKALGRGTGVGRPLHLQCIINRAVLQKSTYQIFLALHILLQLKSQ